MQIKKTINEKTYVYDEKFFSGKKSLTSFLRVHTFNADGTKEGFVDSETGEEYSVSGSFIKGITLNTKSEEIVLVKNKWYEWIVIILPIISIGVGLFCGAIGCMLSVLFSLLCAAINATICRSEKIRSAIVKVIIGIVTSAISTSAWFGIYWLIVQAILK